LTVEAFEAAAASDPQRLLGLHDALPAATRLTAEQAAHEGLARSDPAAAFRHIETLPGGTRRDHLLAAAARAFALHDLDGAVAWVNALRTPSSSAMAGVLRGIAETQPVRAAEILIEQLAQSGVINAARDLELVMASFTPGPRESLSIVADRLSSANDASVETAFDSFINFWSQNDLEAAHDWARTHADRLTAGAVYALARNLAARSDLAKQAVTWIPADQRRGLILSLAQQLARSDLDDTLQWLSGFRDEPVFTEALQFALEALGTWGDTTDPAWAARFLEGQSPSARAGSMAIVANAWARRDPAAAAQWAQSTRLAQADEPSRLAAIGNVASRWAERDHDAAKAWTLGLDRGEHRDRALANVLFAGAEAGRVDMQIVAAFSTDERRERALASALPRLGRSDPERARRLIAEHLADPAVRAQAEAALLRGPLGPLGRD
jgi:hypothetical protein